MLSQMAISSSSSSSSSIAIILVCAILQAMPCQAAVGGNETDRLALLAFKDMITTSGGALASWNDSVHFCQWEGITCNNILPLQKRRVTTLILPSRGLVGTLSPSLANLTFLQDLNLADNTLSGGIPSVLGTHLQRLTNLNLSINSLGGNIPPNLSHYLQYLDLSENQLTGQIPTWLLPDLNTLHLHVNNLTGSIPPSIGNLSSLERLAMGRNSLSGSIPDGIGRLSRLDFLQIAENQLSGFIPPSMYNLSALTFIAIATNQLQGSLPPDLWLALPYLETLYVGGNHLTGHIPPAVGNASSGGLINLDLAYNNFTGSVPADIGKWSKLEWLNFEGNQLGTGGGEYAATTDLSFIDSLTNCTNLQLLDIDSNGIGGVLPNSIVNLTAQLSMLIVSGNRINGNIPEQIHNLAGLTMLRMEHNLLTGNIPASIGRLQNLQLLSLSGNNLSGQIPSSIGNLYRLNELHLQENAIQGNIPPSIGNCRNLQFVDLSLNKLTGSIPPQIISIASLTIFLGLAHNALVGSLPVEVGNLKNLNRLDISENRLSGEVPQSLGDCESMEYLHMEGNMFQGIIPSTLSKLKAIQYIDLSRNDFSGQIPSYLGKIQSLWYLNLSYNDLVGVVPQEGVFRNVSALSVLGNGKLCGGAAVLHLPSCPIQRSKRKGSTRVVVRIVVPILALLLLLCFFAICYLKAKRSVRMPQSVMISSLEETYMKISYRELFKATGGFSSTNLIGQGSHGSVYRGTFDNNGPVVAIKVLDLQHHGASGSFQRECEALRNIRHRNLTKIVTICSSVDSNSNEFKALVYEFMPNGSLEEWLHPDVNQQHRSRVLNIIKRLNIVIDVASALDYLHNQYEVPIVHCDLKPSNVLLDDDLTAHVSDFGLAKLLHQDNKSQFQTGSIGIKGTIGYVPPEYGMGSEVSTLGDVYSFGILLIEMFTGKRPTNASFGEGSCLHDFVKMSYPERVMDIVDPALLVGDKASEDCWKKSSVQSKIQECMVSVIGIGLSCSSASPRERMEMSDVIVKMTYIRSAFVIEEEIYEK